MAASSPRAAPSASADVRMQGFAERGIQGASRQWRPIRA